MIPGRGFQRVWFSLILIVPEGLAPCFSPGQSFSGLMAAGVSNIAEDAAALNVHIYRGLGFLGLGIFLRLPLQFAGARVNLFLGGGRLNIFPWNRIWQLFYLFLLLARRCAYSCIYAVKCGKWGLLTVGGVKG